MALTLTGPDADSLCTVAEADLYHDARGNSGSWTQLETPRKEECLRAAYDYLVGEFRSQWPQGVEFGYLADGSVASGARRSCALLALIATTGELDPEITPQEIESEVGPIKSKFAAAANGGRRIFPAVVRLMTPYLVIPQSNPFSVKLVRA